jgi:hypothetical protein
LSLDQADQRNSTMASAPARSISKDESGALVARMDFRVKPAISPSASLSCDLPRGVILEQGESEMKDSKRNTTFLVALIAGLAFFTSLGAASESKGDLSDKDEDAFILYKYSLIDAKKSLSSKISESTEGNETIYEYDGHALSCRTVMQGSITKTALDNKTHVVGDFDVSNNSFGITRLSFDFYDEGKKARTGTMTVNDKVIDIKHFDRQ